MDLTIRLSLDDVTLLIEALDAYEYWELGDSLPRNNGSVFIPGDLLPENDRYWGQHRPPDDAEVEEIERVQACRDVSDRLAAARRT